MANISKRLIASYVLDWIIIICIIALGAGLWNVTPNHRPFTLTDPSISYPYVEHEKISTATLFIVTVVAPLVITFLLCLLLPLPTTNPHSNNTRAKTWRFKLWSWHTSWLALVLSFALSFLFVQGMKNLFGKPRPDLLSRCDPDVENQSKYALGGYGADVLNGFYLVSSTICRTKDSGKLDDGFSSFPSGHATYAWAGMGYLALFLAGRFGVGVPWTSSSTHNQNTTMEKGSSGGSPPLQGDNGALPATASAQTKSKPAAPPLPLLLLPLIPLCVAIYISSTRFSDFRHHGFDILFGSVMGLTTSIFTFRLYHKSLRRNGGKSWGPRSSGGAFGQWAGFGDLRNYGGGRGAQTVSMGKRDDDIEAGKTEDDGRGIEMGRMEHGNGNGSGSGSGGVLATGSSASTAVGRENGR